MFIFEVQRAPAHGLATIGHGIADRIGIVEASVREEIERWVGICRTLYVGRKLESPLPHAHARDRLREHQLQGAQNCGGRERRSAHHGGELSECGVAVKYYFSFQFPVSRTSNLTGNWLPGTGNYLFISSPPPRPTCR